MEFTPLSLVYDVCIISALIVVAKVVRARIAVFQNLFIPTALIAGFFLELFWENMDSMFFP